MKKILSFLLVAVFSFIKADCRMICGDNVKLCGILVLESGLGPNVYRHKLPTVHGLWPQVDNYGTSECILPNNMDPPKEIYSCYTPTDGETTVAKQLKFESHEWLKHGRCSGCKDSGDYFHQVCSLSEKPLKIMGSSFNKNLQVMADLLKKEGYSVYDIDTRNKQIQLSTCFNFKRKEWVLASIKNFPLFCS